MRRPARAAVAVFLLLFSGAATRPSSAETADPLDEKIQEMQRALAGGDDARCVALMNEVAASPDPRAAAAVRELPKSSSDRIACAAVRLLASKKDAPTLAWLKAELDDKDRLARPEVFKCVLDALAVYRDPGALKPLEEVVKSFLQADGDLATRAIAAYGSVPQKPVVDRLIDWLGSLETSHGGKSSGGAGGHSKYAPEVAKARDASRGALLATLVALTDEDPGDYAAWKKWWSDHGKTFEFPKPDAVGKNVDWATLAEWTDRRYGYTVKRPPGKGWKFAPGDAAFRVRMTFDDASGVRTAFIGWHYYDVANSSFKEMKDYVGWWTSCQFPQHEFEKYAVGGEPTTASMKFAGRDWTVISARGLGKEALSAWGSMERRVYVTKFPDRFIYCWAVVRAEAKPEEKKQAWDAVEGVVFPAK